MQLLAVLFTLFAVAPGNAAERCAVLFETAAGKIEHKVLSSLSVAGLAPEQEFVLPSDAPANVRSIQCGRELLVPGANDYKFLRAGLPLSIVASGRVGVLEAVNGQLRFRMLEGEMTEQESELAQQVLNDLQEQFNGVAAVAP